MGAVVARPLGCGTTILAAPTASSAPQQRPPVRDPSAETNSVDPRPATSQPAQASTQSMPKRPAANAPSGAAALTDKACYLSYHVQDTGAERLGGDGTAARIQLHLQAQGYTVSASEAAREGLEAVPGCQVFVALCSPHYGSTELTSRECQLAGSRGKAILPLWHSGPYPPPPLQAVLSGLQRLPADSTPLVEADFEATMREVVARFRSGGCLAGGQQQQPASAAAPPPPPPDTQDAPAAPLVTAAAPSATAAAAAEAAGDGTSSGSHASSSASAAGARPAAPDEAAATALLSSAPPAISAAGDQRRRSSGQPMALPEPSSAPPVPAAALGPVELKLLKRGDLKLRPAESEDERALLAAAAKGALPEVKRLLASPTTNPNAQDEAGMTALLWACRKGHVKLVPVLLRAGAHVRAKTKLFARLVLGAAGRVGSPGWAASKRGGGVKGHRSGTGCVMVFAARFYAWLLKVAVVLSYHTHVPSYLPRYGIEFLVAPLWAVIRLMHVTANLTLTVSPAMVDELVANKVVDHRHQIEGRTGMVDVLLAAGADVAATTATSDSTALLLASQEGVKDVVEALLGAGADVSAKNADGWTALHSASHRGHTEVVKVLLGAGTAVEARSKNGWTALHWASREGHKKVVEALLRAGADRAATTTPGGRTPLSLATEQGKVEVAALLQPDVGPAKPPKQKDLMVRKAASEWALLAAAKQGDLQEVTRLLSTPDANPNVKSAVRTLLGQERLDRPSLGERHRPQGCGGVPAAGGADLEAKDNEDETALHWASQEGFKEVVEVLLRAGADVAAINEAMLVCVGRMRALRCTSGQREGRGESAEPNCWTALHWASAGGHTDVAAVLLRGGADVQAKDYDGRTPVDLATEEGKVEVVALLQPAIPPAKPPKRRDMMVRKAASEWALLAAAKQGILQDVQRLLSHPTANPNVKSANGWTALHWASATGHKAVVEFLLRAGADVEAKDNEDGTALHWASQEDFKEVVEVLLRAGADVAAINEASRNGWTALHLAGHHGHMQVAAMLLRGGADPEARDEALESMDRMRAPGKIGAAQQHAASAVMRRRCRAPGSLLDAIGGRTPFDLAKEEGKAELVALLQPGIAPAKAPKRKDPVVRNAASEWALLAAAKQGELPEVERLLANPDANPNVKSANGWTALHWACSNGHTEVVEALLRAGADVAAQDNEDGTALHWASQEGFTEVVEVLLRAGANVAATDEATCVVHMRALCWNRWTALHFASAGGHEEVVALLLEGGADVRAKNEDGRTPLDLAKEEGMAEVVALLGEWKRR
ncbi:Ankyrin-3 [Tetrabaena socialis]|uniref:Ankyrin-3 n=1 Tax=Tetrabaena socialis TaxID=47790 RepID=A0A2J7ZSR1_9CHLO|nr:Ankyrin-3 [Tetrabaena socialis]|eukprot:PNH03306.1 Ankyrin-3 [Tetrabaena socialis]